MPTHDADADAVFSEPGRPLVVERNEWSEWRGWNGGERPVETDAMVQPVFLRGSIAPAAMARFWGWQHDGTNSDIIAYRVKREPVVETVRVQLWKRRRAVSGELLAIGTVQTRDGIPDMTTLRWEEAT